MVEGILSPLSPLFAGLIALSERKLQPNKILVLQVGHAKPAMQLTIHRQKMNRPQPGGSHHAVSSLIFREVTIRQRLGRFLVPLFLLHFRVTRGMTLGVRAAVVDGSNNIFLVKHTYVPGWYLPGGGVDPGETAEAALARELMEEGNIAIEGRPQLLGLYQNTEASLRDHVAFFVVRSFSQKEARVPDGEIAQCGFFPIDALPPDTTQATRRRIDELSGRREADGLW
jgi:ADP-ribose pyrophosphatase YjhB (NUDIX family)